MNSTVVVRIARVPRFSRSLLSSGPIGIAIANGIQPGAPLDFSDGAQLLAAGDVTAGVVASRAGYDLSAVGAASRPWPLCRTRGRQRVRTLRRHDFYLGMTLALVREASLARRSWCCPRVMAFFLWLIATG
jgi:hypothetical protein